MAAGYFFAASMARGAACVPLATGLIKRLGAFFVFWSLVYTFLPVEFFLQSPSMTYPAAVRLQWERALFAGAVLLFVIGLLGGAYKETPLGVYLGFGTRNGPFFSTLFVVSGYLLHNLKREFSVRVAVALIAAGIALKVVEVFWITSNSPTTPSQIEYLLGTYPFGIGIFALLLRTEGLGRIRWMVRLSRYSAGIYCAPMLFVDYIYAAAAGARRAAVGAVETVCDFGIIHRVGLLHVENSGVEAGGDLKRCVPRQCGVPT